MMAHEYLPISDAQVRGAKRPRPPRPRTLPALGLPQGREDRRASAAISIALHLLIVLMIIAPFASHELIVERPQGAGGPGPAGGGGGGHGGTGGQTAERLQFVQVAPPPPAAVAAPVPQVQPKIEPPKPVVKPPEPVVQPPVVQAPKVDPNATAATKPLDVASTPGTGGGTGHDGTNGNGPGSGGGTGSGIGTGRGSGIGPGTGGGTQANYPPSPVELYLPPMPVPSGVTGTHVIAEFDIDQTGKVLSVQFTPTRDRDYNKRLDALFHSYRFRPGTKPDGTPIRMKVQITLDL